MADKITKTGDGGQGIWDSNNNPKLPQDSGSASFSKNILSQVGSNAVNVSFNNSGSAGSGSNSGGWGTGPANKPSPDPSLLGNPNTKSPDQASGAANKPSPDPNMLNTSGSKSAGFTVRKPSFGGVEKGVQIQ